MPESVQEGGARHRVRAAAIVLLFAALICGLLAFFSVVLTPLYSVEAKYSVQDAYDLPNNSVEVVAFGPSALRRGVSPAYLYQNYGLSVYDSCTDSQPPIAALYLLKDLIKTQGQSLKVVVVDAATLVKDTEFFDTSTGAERVLACMRPSMNKLEYLMEMTKDYGETVVLEEHLIPVLRYHSRWAELEEEDFKGSMSGEAMKRLCGQPLYPAMFMNNISRGTGGVNVLNPDAITPDSRELGDDKLKEFWNAASVKRIGQIQELCREHGLELLLTTTPRTSWTDAMHDSVSLYAEENGLEYLDMSVGSVWKSTGLSFDTDFYDAKHPNLLGSRKISACLGDFLVKHYDLTDVREGSSHAFLDACLEEYEEAFEDAQLIGCQTLEEYLDMLDRDRYTIFAAAYGEAADALSDQAREKLANLGFTRLSELKTNGSYVGIVEGGRLVSQRKADDGTQVSLNGSFDGQVLIVRKRTMQPGTKFDHPLGVVSKGSNAGPKASVNLEGEDTCEETQGINFVVYNHKTGLLVDSSCFNTHVSSQRTSDILAG